MIKSYSINERVIMKKLKIISIILAIFLLTACNAKIETTNEKSQEPNTVEISFDYVLQDIVDSNQFAVWIEDDQGKFIKTLAVTKYAGDGGWAKRQEILPIWVKISSASGKSFQTVEAISKATPKTSSLKYSWNLTNEDDILVKEGTYKYFVEGNLFRENRVLFSGNIQIGSDQSQNIATAEFFGEAENNKNMITNVKAEYLPKRGK